MRLAKLLNTLVGPELTYFKALLETRIERARRAPSLGASAVEWVLITAVALGIISAISLAVKTVVDRKADEIKNLP